MADEQSEHTRKTISMSHRQAGVWSTFMTALSAGITALAMHHGPADELKIESHLEPRVAAIEQAAKDMSLTLENFRIDNKNALASLQALVERGWDSHKQRVVEVDQRAIKATDFLQHELDDQRKELADLRMITFKLKIVK